jgi:hypothetical protein
MRKLEIKEKEITMQEKFEKLFYEFVPEETKWGDWCNSPQAYFRGSRNIPEATMNCGFQVFTKPVLLQDEPHFHTFAENLVFLGAKLPDVYSSFDSEIHFYMGKTLDSMEKIVITEPTIIKVPKNYWHGPLNFVRVDKPIFFQAVMFSGTADSIKLVERDNGEQQYIFDGEATKKCFFDSNKNCIHCGYCFSHRDECAKAPYSSVKYTVINEDGIKLYSDKGAYDPAKAPSSTTCVVRPGYTTISYSDATALNVPKPSISAETSKLVLVFPKEETSWGDWCPSPQAYFRGDIYMEAADYNVGWQIFTGANDMEEPHFHQGVDEYIFFMGANPMDIFDFDCEIEFAIGDDPDHMEYKIITKPTVVRLPPNVWHCPIKFRKVTKPLMFQAAFMHGTWGTITRSAESTSKKDYFSRKYTYEYMGDNVRFCKFNDKKRCNICGACFPKQANME